ncbi:protein LplC [Spirochaetia bacterium]|nr:protein LplC [Spirochaetia bacterium]
MKKNAFRESRGRRIFTIINRILLGGICFVVVVPIWNVLITSLAVDADVMGNEYLLIPHSFTLINYVRVLNSGYMIAFRNSLFTATLGTIFSIAVTVPMGYALAQKQLIGRNIIMKLVVFTLVFDVGIMPFYMVVRLLGLINTWASIIIPVGLSTFNLIIVKNFMAGIPVSLIESATLDGYDDLSVLIKIVLPLSVPIIAAVTLFYFVGHWNRYFEVVMFINDSRKYTLQVILRSLIFQADDSLGGGNYVYNNLKMAVMVLGMLPVLIIYPFIQKHFVSGLMVGGIKG